MSAFNSKKFQERLILPLGAKEIEFSVPACPSTPSKKSNSWRPGNQDSSPSSTASSSPSQQRNRSFSSAFLFPVGRSSSPLLSPIPHTSCPSSPLPPSSPCPSPSYSQFSHIFNRSFKGSRSPQASTALIVEQQEVIDRADTASPILGSSLYTLGSLNPELYKSCHDLEEETIYPDGHIGRVWFSLDYDRDKEKLNIGLMRIRNLKGKDSENTSCDPLVRIQLMPGERRYHQSSVQKKTCNPVYNENFGFHVHHSELAEQSLKVVVLDNSRSRGRKIIGQLIYSLKNSRLESGRQVIKEDLSKEVVNSPLQAAEILLALCYFPPPCDRITVTILQARNIKSIHSDSPDTYVKVTLLNQTKVVKSKKTNVIKDSSEPCYNENFQFHLTTEQIELANITVSVHQAHSKQKDKPIGKLVLGGFMFARGRGLAHWSEAISRPKEHVQKWHQLPF